MRGRRRTPQTQLVSCRTIVNAHFSSVYVHSHSHTRSDLDFALLETEIVLLRNTLCVSDGKEKKETFKRSKDESFGVPMMNAGGNGDYGPLVLRHGDKLLHLPIVFTHKVTSTIQRLDLH